MFSKFSRRYWPIILFLWIIAKLPWSHFLYPLGNILGHIFFFLSRNGKRYNIIETNLRILLKRKLADKKYNKALNAINRKHMSKISSLDLAKEKEIKAKLKAVKNNPDQIDKILKDMGITEV